MVTEPAHQVVVLFELKPGDVAEELRRIRLMFEAMRQRPGFEYVQVAKVGAGQLALTQRWRSLADFEDGLKYGHAALEGIGPDLALSREIHAGPVVLSQD